jgi:transcription elongation factor GreB
MSRWRPPRPKSSPYITPEGYKTLETEMNQLCERRKHVTAAAAEGDRSENAEDLTQPFFMHHLNTTYCFFYNK